MSIAGSDSMEGKAMVLEIMVAFRSLLGEMKLPFYWGNPAEFHDWLVTVQKKQLLYGLTDQEMLLLAYEAAAGPVSKFIGDLYRENS